MSYSKASWGVLAALRFVLALIVFDVHVWLVGFPSCVQAFLPLSAGHVAVMSFLLISGVSIGYSYRERAHGFYTRRFLRIYPLYFAALLFTQAISVAVPSLVAFPALTIHTARLQTTVANLFFLQGIAAIPIPYDRPVWSLSLEAWLYVLTPLFFRIPRWTLLSLIAVSLFVFGFQGGSCFDRLPGLYLFKWAWPWPVGFLFARDESKALCLVLGLAGSVLLFVNEEFSRDGTVNALILTSILGSVLWAGQARLSKRIEIVANFLGNVSYPLYLFHLPMMILLFTRFGVRSEIGFLVAVLVFVIALEVFYEGKLKRVFWKPVTHWIAQRLPSSWTLVRDRA